MDSPTIKMDVNQGVSAQFVDFPIPAEQIREGAPKSKVWVTSQSADRKLTHGVWHCTACQFTWDYTWDEFVMILDGEVIITDADGESHTLRTGDCAYFSPGLKTTWHIPVSVKKVFTIRSPAALEL